MTISLSRDDHRRWLVAQAEGELTIDEVINFLQTARAKGASRARVFVRHTLQNALIPVVTVIGMDFGGLLGGAVATEYVFAWPGLGKTIVRAIGLRDLPVVEGGVLFLTAVFVLVSLAIDLAYLYLDPRIHYAPSG